MEHVPSLLSKVESDKMVERMEREFEERGYGLGGGAGDTEEFIGYTGLPRVAFEASFTPAVEIGWRLTQGSWGLGFASEAARRALAFAFEDQALPEVVSFTLPANTRSQAVMRRIGMVRDTAGDFDHPNLLDNDRVRRQILHRLSRAEWLSNNSL
jgi:ribosomal-protein-alanine N-acetyltransferase